VPVAEDETDTKSAGAATTSASAAVAQVRSALNKIAEARDAVQQVESLGVGGIVADFGDRRELEALQRIAAAANDHISAMQESLRHLLGVARDEYALWKEQRRFTPETVQRTLAELGERAKEDPGEADAASAAEVVAALSRREFQAASRLLEGWPDGDTRLAPGLGEVAAEVRAWADGDAEAGVRACRRLSDLLSDPNRLPMDAKAQLALLVATAEQEVGRGDDAVRTMDTALGALHSPVLEAERAGLSLLQGDVDDAARRAHRATELAPDQPDGYFHLGACSEPGGDFAGAGELYEEGCERSTLLMLCYLGTGATFLRPTGLLQLQRARRLANLGHAPEALQAVDDALRVGVTGTARYSNAPAHQLRADLLAALGRPEESAQAALQAGKEFAWDGDTKRALVPLEQAWRAQPPIRDAGWYYADALCAMSWPQTAPAPDAVIVARARQVWDERFNSLGPPTAESAWAYGTRALLAELGAYTGHGDYGASYWEATLFIEKALVLQNDNPRLWGLSARFLRAISLESLALESADRGFTLGPDDAEVLSQRLALLSNAGRYAEAEETLNRIPGRDADPWVMGVYAWLLNHRGRYAEAVQALELPLSGGYDPGWYLELRADCLAHLGEFPAAAKDLERLLEVDVNMGSDSTLRRALALANLGRADEAFAEAEQIEVGDQLTAAEVESVRTVLNLGRGNLAEARSAGMRALQSARNVREIDDALNSWRTCLDMLTHRGVDVQAGCRVVDELRAWSQSPDEPTLFPDAEAEMQTATDQHAHDAPGSQPSIALSAITARRLLASGSDVQRAEAILRGLAGTVFEPEASAAITMVLQQRLEGAVSAGHELLARQLYEELVSRGKAPAFPLEVVVAEALAATRRYGQALDVLTAARIRDSADAASARLVDERIGEYAMLGGDIEKSLATFGRLSQAARADGDSLAEAQADARMAVALAVRGDRDRATEHLVHALTALRQAGSVAPSLTLGHELAAVAKAMDAQSAIGSLSECLRRAAERVDPADQGGTQLLDALTPMPTDAPTEIDQLN
jgi:tetratricopeptide (TPR) repeat protein